MSKDFSRWNAKKIIIDEKTSQIFFHEREIWFCHLGNNVGFEQDGKGETFGRPVIIFRKFNNRVFWGIPLTTKDKSGTFYFKIGIKDNVCRVAILSQLRLLDARRLYQKIGVVDAQTFYVLRNRIIDLCSDI